MRVKLVALDLDDTLLDPGLMISPQCVKAIQEVRRQGVVVTISTGRMYSSALPYAMQLKLDVPLITYQGALVKCSISGEVLYYKPVPAQYAREVMELFRDAGVHYHGYFNDRLCMERLSPEGVDYAALAGVKAVVVEDLLAEAGRQETLKIMAIINDEEAILDMQQRLRGAYGDKLHITPYDRKRIPYLVSDACRQLTNDI